MKRELYAFVSNFIIYLFLFICLFFCYAYFFGSDYLEKYRLIATFFDTVLGVYHYFNGFFIFFICIYFIFLSQYEIRVYLKEYKGYLFRKFYPFVFLFFIVGVIVSLIFNFILPYTITQRSEYRYSYERYNLLENQANEIVNKVKGIDISLSVSKILDANDLIEAMKKKRKYLEDLIRIYNKMRLIDFDNDELSTNYYLVKSEYNRMPIYDVDLEKIRKTIKTYLIRNLTKKDFQDIVNELIDKGDYATANYFAYIGFASTRDDELAALLDLTFKAINENKNIESEKRHLVLEEKQKNFLYFNTEKFRDAYYGFLRLHKLFPNDNEILSYKNKSLEKLRSEYLFFDEIEKYYEHHGINDVLLFQSDSGSGTFDYIYMQKIVSGISYLKMVKNFELIRFNKSGNIVFHIKVPFATLKGNEVYQNVLDKDNEESNIIATKIIVSSRDFDLNEPAIISINKDVDNLHLFSNSSSNIFLPAPGLLNAFNQVEMLNLRLISIFSFSLLLLINPMLLVLWGVLFMGVSSKVSFEFDSKFIIFLICIMIAIFSVIISLFINYLLFILIAVFIQMFANIYVPFVFILFLLFIFIFHLIRVNYREA
ncbi:hypothetical protein DB313_01810 [Borrelia turcica IST7]|uniref:Uncharacterized protein n=1 Tax=Borrelia turcica IST7 TaxID=1104446 RepID=A0A386PKI4_9SPIR|nr:hypothetical protein [Borrelia turcica]AYE36231.1 hypothetical protein DB313_01810 [Borrelia turcica IST7]